jgi:hypothetical protein
MATSEVKSGKAYTAPKGRPTVHPTAGGSRHGLSPVMQWLLALIVFLAVLGAIFYFGRGFRTAGGGGHSGLPADAPISVPVDIDPAPALRGSS